MSWRQPATNNVHTARSSLVKDLARTPRGGMVKNRFPGSFAGSAWLVKSRKHESALIRHLRDLARVVALQETPGLIQPEFRVLRFDAEEETVTAGAHKVGRIE